MPLKSLVFGKKIIDYACNSSYFSLSRYALWVTILYKALEISIIINIILASSMVKEIEPM